MTLILTPEDLNRARLACGAAATHLRAKRTTEAKDEARRYDHLAGRFATEREHQLANPTYGAGGVQGIPIHTETPSEHRARIAAAAEAEDVDWQAGTPSDEIVAKAEVTREGTGWPE